MTLTDSHKASLQQHLEQIKDIFETHKHSREYMGVYFNARNGQPFITFSNIDNFRLVLRMAGNVNHRCCVFVCANEFDAQALLFLA